MKKISSKKRTAEEGCKSVKHAKGITMLVCCLIVMVLLIAAVYFFGIGRNYSYWLILLLCPLMHFFMMRDMHNKPPKKGNGDKCH